MIECKTLIEAMRVPGVIHVEAGDVFIAYESGDALPPHCIVGATDAEPTELETLKRTVEMLESRVRTVEARR